MIALYFFPQLTMGNKPFDGLPLGTETSIPQNPEKMEKSDAVVDALLEDMKKKQKKTDGALDQSAE